MQKKGYIQRKLHNGKKRTAKKRRVPTDKEPAAFPARWWRRSGLRHNGRPLGANSGGQPGCKKAARFPTPSLDVACHALVHQLHRERLFLMSCPARFHGNSGIKKCPVLLQHKALFHNFLSIFGLSVFRVFRQNNKKA